MTTQTQTGTPARPADYGQEVRDAVAARLLPLLVEWIEAVGEVVTDAEKVVYLRHLEEALRFPPWDGYRLARDLHNVGFDPDANLVESLDAAHGYRYQEHRRIVAEWVKAQAVKLRHEIGDVVKVNDRHVRCEGVVVSLDRVHATYTVRLPEHMQPLKTGMQALGIVVNAEDVS